MRLETCEHGYVVGTCTWCSVSARPRRERDEARAERDRLRQALEDVHDELQENRLEDAIQLILNTLDSVTNQTHDREG